MLDKETCIYISGKNRLNRDEVPSNVVLTGFVPTKDYQNLLRSADIGMVLTSQEDCLVCGGYESVSAEKPLILSDTEVLREYFDKGTVFTGNNANDIAGAIKLAIKNRYALEKNIRKLKSRRNSEWQRQWERLMGKLSCVKRQ